MRYVLLIKWVDRGLAAAEDSQAVIPHAKKAFEESGGTVHELVHCMGDIDLVAVVSAASPEDITAFTLTLGWLGQIRTVTLPAFDTAEMDAVVLKAQAIRTAYIRGGGKPKA